MKYQTLFLLLATAIGTQAAELPPAGGSPAADGYVSLFDGKTLDQWILVTKDQKEETARKVFTVEDGVIHVYKEFPDGYQLAAGKNDTHGLMVSKRSYSRYSVKFDYKWGTKRLNNFDQWQYDAGFYYHMQNQNVWPTGLEYQIRFNHKQNRNYTADLWNLGVSFTWYQGPRNTYLHESAGGKPVTGRKFEHCGSTNTVVHALDGQWNQCEVIAMGDAYAIHKLNGQVVNYATSFSKGSGPIALQAETAEIYYRNIWIKEFPEPLPAEQFLK